MKIFNNIRRTLKLKCAAVICLISASQIYSQVAISGSIEGNLTNVDLTASYLGVYANFDHNGNSLRFSITNNIAECFTDAVLNKATLNWASINNSPSGGATHIVWKILFAEFFD